MAIYNTHEQFLPEAYMMSSNPDMVPTLLMEGVNYMGKQDMASEFVYDHNLYYPAPASNYYGYQCTGPTGFESSGDWSNHQYFFPVDSQGQSLQYSDLQNESSSYVYYTSSYPYDQSSYNPYNPYIPGAVGVDGTYAGAQHYLTSTPYQQPISSTSYFPVVYPSPSNAITTSNGLLLGTGAPATNKLNSQSRSYVPTMVPANATVTSQKFPLESTGPVRAQTFTNQFNGTIKRPENSLVNAISAKQFSSRDAVPAGKIPWVNEGRSSSYLNPESVYGRSPVADSLKITPAGANGYTGLGSRAYGYSTFDKFKNRFNQYNRSSNSTTGNPDFLGEQNRGPRAYKPKGQLTSPFLVRAFTTKAGDADIQGNIRIHGDQYNGVDLLDDYPEARLFVIKSYSEDDVHKSIKYNVWSSTPNGNKRLASAYEDSQRMSLVKRRSCPIFLFFSVNASGHFCGIAEMTGPVDFSKNMDFWQQDKWTGSFPVKWHVVKDVPNLNFRQVLLENNENKPVTNSRDTQEITYTPGMKMLNIFKNSPMKLSIIDDFMYYEERERAMYQERCKYSGRKFDNSAKVVGQIAHSQELLNTEGTSASNSLNQSLTASEDLNADLELTACEELNADYVPPLVAFVNLLIDAEQSQDADKNGNIATKAVKEFSHDAVGTGSKSYYNHLDSGIEPVLSVDGNPPNDAAAILSNDAEKLANGDENLMRKDEMQGSDIAKDASSTEEQPKCLPVERQKMESVTNGEISDKKICADSIVNPNAEANRSISLDEGKREPTTCAQQGGTLADVVTVGSMQIIVRNPSPSEA